MGIQQLFINLLPLNTRLSDSLALSEELSGIQVRDSETNTEIFMIDEGSSGTPRQIELRTSYKRLKYGSNRLHNVKVRESFH